MNSDVTAHFGLLTVDLFIPASQSLKNKRQVLKSLKDKIRSRFNVSVAELDRQDKWQTATLGFCMLGTDRRYINGGLEKILVLVQNHYAAEVSDHQIEFF